MICNLKQNCADDTKVTLKVDIVSLFEGCVGNPWHPCQMSFCAENGVYTGTDARVGGGKGDNGMYLSI